MNTEVQSELINITEVDRVETEGDFDLPELPPLPNRKCLRTGNKYVNLFVEGWDHIINESDLSKSEVIMQYTWKNKNRMKVQVITYGATITNIYIPDRKGKVEDVLLGFDDLKGYQQTRNPYFGATIGRVTDIIDNATFQFEDGVVNLSPNKRNHHFHGGFRGFDKALWEAHNEGTKVIMTHISRAGHEGYPGSMFLQVIFDVSPTSKLSVDFSAKCDHPTIINMSTQFPINLAGHGEGACELYKHLVQINSHKFLKVNDEKIPTGNFKCVGGTYYDFRIPRSLGSGIRRIMEGYDHTMVITRDKLKELNFVAKIMHPCSGRVLEIYSDQPALYFGSLNELPDPDNLAIPRDIYDRSMVYAIVKMKDKCYNIPASDIMLEPPIERLRGGASQSTMVSDTSIKVLAKYKFAQSKKIQNKKNIDKSAQIFIPIKKLEPKKPIVDLLDSKMYMSNKVISLDKFNCSGVNHKLIISKTVHDILANMSIERKLMEQRSSLHERIVENNSESALSKLERIESLSESPKGHLRAGQSITNGQKEYYLNTPCTELCTCKLTDSQKQALYNSMFGPGPMTFGVGVDADLSDLSVRIECILGKQGKRYCKHAGFVIRTEKYPDAVHHDHFPSITLRPGDTYHQRTTYKFGLQFNPDQFFVPPKCESDMSFSMFSF